MKSLVGKIPDKIITNEIKAAFCEKILLIARP